LSVTWKSICSYYVWYKLSVTWKSICSYYV